MATLVGILLLLLLFVVVLVALVVALLKTNGHNKFVMYSQSHCGLEQVEGNWGQGNLSPVLPRLVPDTRVS